MRVLLSRFCRMQPSRPDAATSKTGLFVLSLLCASVGWGQASTGAIRFKVTGPDGRALKTTIQITGTGNQYSRHLKTNDQGALRVETIPFGVYQVRVREAGFAVLVRSLDVRTTLLMNVLLQLQLVTVQQSVQVSAVNTLIDPDQPGRVDQIGSQFIRDRLASIPGRDLQDLVNSQPGWLYEGNAVLHPRGSEYQTQFVVDGIPLTDNRSPGFGPVIEAEDIQSMSLYTAGFPAEYGRKMGGVIEVNTLRDAVSGFHGETSFSGGTYVSEAGFAKGQYAWGRNVLGAGVSGTTSEHYLNPVVPQNDSNTGTTGDFSTDYARDLTTNDRVKLSVRHELARYDIPNEIVQQAAGQRQTADNFETVGTASYQHSFSEQAAADLRGMVRDNSNGFNSNPASTPLELFQQNYFKEGYVKGTFTLEKGRNEWKAGLESDNLFLHEHLNYLITDATQFDPGSPLTFAYKESRPDLEQAAFVEDTVRWHDWTMNAGLRWDHYQLLLNRQAVQPRLAISHYFKPAEAVLHFSYDRIFQTPSFENILLSSSPAVASIDPTGFLRLPVQPSQGNYYEGGLTKVFFNHLKLGSDIFRRDVTNYADDSQIANSTISFPIDFRKAVIYGVEAKLEIPEWHRVSGYANESYIVGNVFFPVEGGLFFGQDAAQAASQLNGHSPDSQDQRHSVRARARYQATPRMWFAFGLQYDSGLPFDFDGDPATVLAQYGPEVLSRINFARGRIYPTFQSNASAGAEVYRSDRATMRLQVDGQNLNNALDVIDFGGLFSGNAIGPGRNVSLRLSTSF